MLLPDSKTELVRRGNKVVYDLGDKIVKVFNETKPVSDVFNEALNLARINECGIRSPKALEVSQLENANGWTLVTEQGPGTTPRREGSGPHPCREDDCRAPALW